MKPKYVIASPARHELREGGPYPGSKTTGCFVCSVDVYMAPSTWRFAEKHRGEVAHVCGACVRIVMLFRGDVIPERLPDSEDVD